MKLLYYLAAIGETNYSIKQDVFFKNIDILASQKDVSIDVLINMYDMDESFLKRISENSNIDKMYVHYKKGVLVELWKSNPHNDIISEYDYVLLILDDVMLINFNIQQLIDTKTRYSLDIISPVVHKSTHTRLMDSFNQGKHIRITNAIEIYCVCMEPSVFQRYIDTHDIGNKWMWGHDFMLGYFGFKCGIYNGCNCLHLFPQKDTGFSIDARRQMNTFISKHGFSSLHDICNKYPPILAEL